MNAPVKFTHPDVPLPNAEGTPAPSGPDAPPQAARRCETPAHCVNHGALRLFEWRADGGIGSQFGELTPEEPVRMATASRVLLRVGEWSGELRFRTRDGTAMTARGRWTLVRDSDGQPRFVLLTPAEGGEPRLPAAPTLGPAGHGELVLVVDDELCIQQITKDTLEHSGYRVRIAGDGAEALGFYAREQQDVRAVVTDIMMPVMDGVALTRALRWQNPGLPILISTGVGSCRDLSDRLREVGRLGVTHVLSKPYDGPVLLAALRDALDNPGTSTAPVFIPESDI